MLSTWIVTADQLSERARQRQSKTSVFHFPLQARLNLGKLLEDPNLVHGRDTDAGIAN